MKQYVDVSDGLQQKISQLTQTIEGLKRNEDGLLKTIDAQSEEYRKSLKQITDLQSQLEEAKAENKKLIETCHDLNNEINLNDK